MDNSSYFWGPIITILVLLSIFRILCIKSMKTPVVGTTDTVTPVNSVNNMITGNTSIYTIDTQNERTNRVRNDNTIRRNLSKDDPPSYEEALRMPGFIQNVFVTSNPILFMRISKNTRLSDMIGFSSFILIILILFILKMCCISCRKQAKSPGSASPATARVPRSRSVNMTNARHNTRNISVYTIETHNERTNHNRTGNQSHIDMARPNLSRDSVKDEPPTYEEALRMPIVNQ
uniref:CSON009587 protein n=1 Tax=Culicoides sonorensis TaxID=179676 RepID=A0A336M4A4_CULSO